MSFTEQRLLVRGSKYFDHQHFYLCDQPSQGIMSTVYLRVSEIGAVHGKVLYFWSRITGQTWSQS
jgi:hypothetical protein